MGEFMAERVGVRDITNDEGNRLRRIVRRGQGSVVTWRGAQMGLRNVTALYVRRREYGRLGRGRPAAGGSREHLGQGASRRNFVEGQTGGSGRKVCVSRR